MTLMLRNAMRLVDGSVSAKPLRGVLDLIASVDVLREHLESLDREERARLASMSYAHPNQFEKVVLFEDRMRKVVLHAWNLSCRDKTEARQDIHDHRWRFCSKVLVGLLRMEHWRLDPIIGLEHDEVARELFDYESPSGGDEYSRRRVGLRTARLEFVAEVPAGTTYELAPDIIHSIQPATSEPLVTLFLQTPPIRSSSRVLVDSTRIAGSSVAIEPFTVDEWADLAERILMCISEKGA